MNAAHAAAVLCDRSEAAALLGTEGLTAEQAALALGPSVRHGHRHGRRQRVVHLRPRHAARAHRIMADTGLPPLPTRSLLGASCGPPVGAEQNQQTVSHVWASCRFQYQPAHREHLVQTTGCTPADSLTNPCRCR